MYQFNKTLKIIPLMDLHLPKRSSKIKLMIKTILCFIFGHKRALWGHEFNFSTREIDTNFICTRCGRFV